MEYKGIPMIRSGNIIYLGDYSKEYVIRITIKSYRKMPKNDVELPSRLILQLMKTEKNRSPIHVVKSIERPSLIMALNLGYDWLINKLGEVPENE